MAGAPARSADPAAQALLGWMQAHGDRLRELLDQEAGASDDHGPVSDAAIRAHLRFVSVALAACAAPATRPVLEAFARNLPQRMAGGASGLAEQLERVTEAAALEVGLQFGQAGNEDPLTRKVVERRLRVNAWQRFFLDLLDEATGARRGVAAVGWMAGHQERLGDLIFATDRAAKRAIAGREGEAALADGDRVNLVGQAAMLQAHTRFLVEAIAAAG